MNFFESAVGLGLMMPSEVAEHPCGDIEDQQSSSTTFGCLRIQPPEEEAASSSSSYSVSTTEDEDEEYDNDTDAIVNDNNKRAKAAGSLARKRYMKFYRPGMSEIDCIACIEKIKRDCCKEMCGKKGNRYNCRGACKEAAKAQWRRIQHKLKLNGSVTSFTGCVMEKKKGNHNIRVCTQCEVLRWNNAACACTASSPKSQAAKIVVT